MAKIVSIHSFRGGTGKSNVTANVSAQFAKKGYRVGVIDTDINPKAHCQYRLPSCIGEVEGEVGSRLLDKRLAMLVHTKFDVCAFNVEVLRKTLPEPGVGAQILAEGARTSNPQSAAQLRNRKKILIDLDRRQIDGHDIDSPTKHIAPPGALARSSHRPACHHRFLPVMTICALTQMIVSAPGTDRHGCYLRLASRRFRSPIGEILID